MSKKPKGLREKVIRCKEFEVFKFEERRTGETVAVSFQVGI